MLVISVVIILLLKLFRVNKYAGDIFRGNQKFFYGFALVEYILLYFLLGIQNKILKIENLVITIVVVSGIAVVLMILFMFFFVKSVNIEKNILEIEKVLITENISVDNYLDYFFKINTACSTGIVKNPLRLYLALRNANVILSANDKDNQIEVYDKLFNK